MKTSLWYLLWNVIIIILLAVLVGCGNENTDNGNGQNGYDVIGVDNNDSPESERLPRFLPIPDDVGEIVDVCIGDDKIFISYMVHTDREYTYNNRPFYIEESNSVIYSMNADGTDFAELSQYAPSMTAPADSYGGSIILAMHIDNEGYLWVFELWSFYRYELPDDFNRQITNLSQLWEHTKYIEGGCAVRKLDSTGSELLFIDTNSLHEQYSYYNYMSVIALCTDELQNVYLCLENTETGSRPIVLIDANDYSFHEVDSTSWVERFVYLPDGAVAFRITAADEDGNSSLALQVIDPVSKSLGEIVFLFLEDEYEKEVFTGSYGNDFLFADGQALYGYKLNETHAEEFLRWNDFDIFLTRGGDMLDIVMVSDECIYCIRRSPGGYRVMYQYELITLSTTLNSDISDKAVLTLGTVRTLSPDMQNYIAAFNRENLDYQVEIIDYTEYNTDNNHNGALERLALDITAGKAPDIIAVAGLPYREYAAKGLFADLWPYIDSDSEYERNDFVAGVFKTAEINEHLYQVFPTFGIRTVIGNPDVLGPETGWNMDEFSSVLLSHPDAEIPIGAWMSKEDALFHWVTAVIDDYVDWDNHTVSFDSAGFIRLLELVNSLPAAIERDYQHTTIYDIAVGHQLMVFDTIWSFNHYPGLKAMFGKNIVLKGFPAENRDGNVIDIEDGLTITESSINKDAAWAFVRTLLNKNSQLPNGRFPTNLAAFMQKATDEIEDGTIFEREFPGFRPFTEKDLAQILDLLGSSNIRAENHTDDNMWYIVREDASAYFDGDIDAEEAAQRVQSRISRLVSERS